MTGEVVISVELELGWGKHDRGSYDYLSRRREKETEYLKRLLDVCNRTGVPITFNVVGHLCHPMCEMTRVRKDVYPSGWWREHDQSNEDNGSLFHAPDLLRKIQRSEINHEFASHTYSHIMVDEVSAELISHEFDLVDRIFEQWNIDSPVSFVAPRHRQCSPALLNKHGIKVIRRPSPRQSKPGSITSLWVLTKSHPVHDKYHEDGLIKTYSTSYPSLTYSGGMLPKGQLAARNQFTYLPLSLRQKIHQHYLKNAVHKAINQNKQTHLWTHLWDMSNPHQWATIESFFEWLGEKRHEGAVEISRMKDLAVDSTTT